MADRKLENVGIMSGTYAGTPFQDSQSSVVEVMLTGVKFEKSADQSIWFDGQLTMTFTIDNTDGEGPLDNLVITDMLDNTKFKYDDETLVLELSDNQDPATIIELVLGTDYTVSYVEDAAADKDSLQITLLPAPGGRAGSIPVGSTLTISFRGDKVAETP